MNQELYTGLRLAMSEIDEKLAKIAFQRGELERQEAVLLEERGHISALLPEEPKAIAVTDGLTVLGDLNAVTGTPRPRELLLPNQELRQLKSWRDLILEVAKYLVREGHLTKEMCPIRMPRARQELLVSTNPEHHSGRFRSPVDIGNGMWLELHGSAPELWTKTCFLVETCGVNLMEFSVRP